MTPLEQKHLQEQEGDKSLDRAAAILSHNVHESAVHTLDLQKAATEKGYEKIEPLGIWYLGHKRHEHYGEYGQEYWYTHDLLGKDLKKLEKIRLPDGTILYSPKYGGANNHNIIITHGILAPLFEKYALFDKSGSLYTLTEKDGKTTSGRLAIDKNGVIHIFRKGNGLVGFTEFQGSITSIVSKEGKISTDTMESTELDFLDV